ncbi:MAG: glycosyl hydrolase, partial [Chthoniobacterales bacterium]
PDNTVCLVGGSGSTSYVSPQITGGTNNYLVIGYLPATSNLSAFQTYAYARPTNTALSWSRDPVNGRVTTTWNITATAMKGSNVMTIQGWLPHQYRTTTTNFSYQPYTYQTQRGIMKTSIGSSFQINFPFAGLAVALPAPATTGYTNNFQSARMTTFLTNFNPGSMLGNTYDAGKALNQCAKFMVMANEMGDTTNFNRLKTALTNALQNWLTYTPGENNGFYARYTNWKALIGFDVGYGSQGFNDLHFHYGYHIIAAAQLAKYDKTFLANYGPMLRLIVKAFANDDRADTTQPFLRTLDVWEGHSNAGGMSSANGENQESSSEAMNSWVGIYLLGSMLNDSQMTSLGAMGFSMESRAINEYWTDLYQTNFPASYNRAGVGILWADSFTFATYFSADPTWVYAIQYVPSAHWNNYLVQDQVATASAKYQQMWAERNAWNGDTSTTPDSLGAYPGNYVFAYQALWDHANTPAMFDNYYTANLPIAKSNTYSGETYYLIHALRQLGDQDFTYSASVPTAAVYFNATSGVRKAVVYNPGTTTVTVSLYKNGATVQTVSVPANSSTTFVVGSVAPPSITSALTKSGIVGTALTYNITATNSPTSYNATPLPPGLVVNTTTGAITGTPTASGTTNTTISATNAGGTGSATLVFTISAAGGDTNIAQGVAAVTASSFQVGNEIAKGNDGVTTSRWAAADGTFPQWWQVDFGSNKVLSRADIAWYSSATRSSKYKIETATNAAGPWTLSVDKTTNTTVGDSSDSFTATARYVKITIVGTSAGFASAYEFKIFGH